MLSINVLFKRLLACEALLAVSALEGLQTFVSQHMPAKVAPVAEHSSTGRAGVLVSPRVGVRMRAKLLFRAEDLRAHSTVNAFLVGAHMPRQVITALEAHVADGAHVRLRVLLLDMTGEENDIWTLERALATSQIMCRPYMG
jgi:hypothetical protein